jgi:hypothetical protein
VTGPLSHERNLSGSAALRSGSVELNQAVARGEDEGLQA